MRPRASPPPWLRSFRYAAATTDAGGWSAEIRIPLSTLRFEVEDGRVLMGATVYRRIARKNEYISWPAIDQQWGFSSRGWIAIAA